MTNIDDAFRAVDPLGISVEHKPAAEGDESMDRGLWIAVNLGVSR